MSGTSESVVDAPSLPRHIGIIMDGNGRWAQQRNKPRTAGHKAGIDTAKKIILAAISRGIPYLTLYTFSTENWKRAEKEVSFLMKLIVHHIKTETEFYRSNKIRFQHAGDTSGLPRDVQKGISHVLEDTASYSAIVVTLALNYGGKNEIVRAVNRWISESPEGSIREEDISHFLDNPEDPDPDLIIRTGGEQRISNFLLWQSAYSEFYFSEKLWPDWSDSDLDSAIYAYQKRKRKFGGEI